MSSVRSLPVIFRVAIKLPVPTTNLKGEVPGLCAEYAVSGEETPSSCLVGTYYLLR
jgi:hypothetical protein